MKLTPESKRIAEIFPMELDTVYSVPIYQRNYSWKESNIEQLFNDINAEKPGYYLGNLLVTPNGNNTYDVVDGQQRLTTIALFLLGLYNFYTELVANPDLINQGSAIGIAYGDKNDIERKLITTDKKPKLQLLENDSVIYNDLLKVINNEDKTYRPHKNRIFGKRFNYINTLIRDEFFDENDLAKSISDANEFFKKLNQAEILRITVNNLRLYNK